MHSGLVRPVHLWGSTKYDGRALLYPQLSKEDVTDA